MDDMLVIQTKRTLPWLRRSMFGMYRWTSAGIVIIATTIFVFALCATTRGPSIVLDWMPFLVYMAVIALFLVPLHFKQARKLYETAREAAPPVFTATADRIRCEYDGNINDLSWSSIHSVCVSPGTIYIFVNRNCA